MSNSAQAQAGIPGLTADSAALKAQIIRLEGMLQAAQDNRNKSTFELDALKQQLAFAEEKIQGLEEQLRNTQSQENLPLVYQIYLHLLRWHLWWGYRSP